MVSAMADSNGSGRPSPARAKSAPKLESGPEYKLPTKKVIEQAARFPLYDAQGKEVAFKSLYIAEDGQRRRVLILFVRHFFCGNCQEYLRSLTSALPPSSLPADLSLVVIGCGSHTLITSYIDHVGSFPYPIYAEPSKKLYELLGMQYNLSLGWKSPSYIHRSLVRVNLESVVQGVKRFGSGDALSGGDMRLNGGEFLFEVQGEKEDVTWCHRMTNTRDHAEIETLRQILRLDEAQDKSAAATSRPATKQKSTGDRIRRSLSTRRQSLLAHTGSLSSKENSRERGQRGGSPNVTTGTRIEVVREEMRSHKDSEKPATAKMDAHLGVA